MTKSKSNHDLELRQHVAELLRWGSAHVTLEQALEHLPLELVNTRPPSLPYTAWQLLEHLRLAQRDILEFMRDPQYQEPAWPDDYWPKPGLEADRHGFEKTVQGLRDDLEAIIAMALDPHTDLFATIPHGSGQTYLREFLLVADHNAYHVGGLVMLRHALNAWPPSRS